MQSKAVYLFGTTNTASTHTMAQPSVGGIQDAKTFYNRLNVLIKVGTFTTVGGGTAVVSFQERFSGLGFIETASTTAITGTGNYWLLRDPVNSDVTNTRMKGGFPALGTGFDKQIVNTVSSITAFGAEMYLVFHQN